MSKDWPDFGMVRSVFEQPPYEPMVLEARAVVPGATLSELTSLYERTFRETPEEGHYSGDPSKWPSVRALNAVIDCMFAALRDGGYEIVKRKS